MVSDSTENPSLSVLRAAGDWLVLLAGLLAGALAGLLLWELLVVPLELHAARVAAAASASAAAATPLWVERVTETPLRARIHLN
jgi:hypothetical protein